MYYLLLLNVNDKITNNFEANKKEKNRSNRWENSWYAVFDRGVAKVRQATLRTEIKSNIGLAFHHSNKPSNSEISFRSVTTFAVI